MLTTRLHPLLKNTVVQIYSFPVILHIPERNSRFSLHIKTDALFYLSHRVLKNILAINTMFCNLNESLLHEALNFVTTISKFSHW